jgi:hypothetical protein
MPRPLQVYVDEGELERLEAWSRERGWTKSQAIRAALRALTGGASRDPLLGASGMIQGLPPDLSESFDLALQETFVVAPKKSSRARRPKGRVRR